MVSLLRMIRTENSHAVAVYELEPPYRGIRSIVPRIRTKKSLVFLGRLILPDILLLNRGWYDMLVDFNCRERMEKGLWSIMEAAKLENHQVIDWFTKRKRKEETIVIHVVRVPESLTALERA